MPFLSTYWPALFGFGTMALQMLMDPSPEDLWPPKLDLKGTQAVAVLTSPVWLAVVIPLTFGLILIATLVKKHSISRQDHASMVWWIMNLFWFHTGCDVLSGFFQVMPVLTDLYRRMNPAHNAERWHESRAHLDSAYALEALIEVPLCAWTLALFIRQDPGRYVAEIFTLAVQFTGTVTYYAPGLVKMEAASWLSHLDRLCGSVWMIFPCIVLQRHLAKARGQTTKAHKGKKS
jgi:hypothetical protein